jgi:hypothetical protein
MITRSYVRVCGLFFSKKKDFRSWEKAPTVRKLSV